MVLDYELRGIANALATLGKLVALRIVEGMPVVELEGSRSRGEAEQDRLALGLRQQESKSVSATQHDRVEAYIAEGYQILSVGRRRNSYIFAVAPDGTICKTCTKCMRMLPLESFHKNAGVVGGVGSVCIQCRFDEYARGGRNERHGNG